MANNVQCHICYKYYSSASSLQRHLKNICAAPTGSYKCDFCIKTFKRADLVKRHIQEYHKPRLLAGVGDPNADVQALTGLNSKETAIKCLEEGCNGKNFPQLPALKTHLQKTHGKEFRTTTHIFPTEEGMYLLYIQDIKSRILLISSLKKIFKSYLKLDIDA